MSGGHFDYKQYEISRIADEVEQLALENKDSRDFSPETVAEFQKGLKILRQAYIYAQRIDWLVCGDDGEDSFRRRLNEELTKLEK